MWIYRPEDDNYFSQLAKCSDGDDVGECVIYFDPDDVPPSPAQGAMFAEALNVHEAAGLTPSQLQARAAELEVALRGVTGVLDQMGDQPDRLVCPEVWRRLNCEELVTLGKEALGVE